MSDAASGTDARERYALQHPIQPVPVRKGAPVGEPITEINLRRATAKDLIAMERQRGAFRQGMTLLSLLSGVPFVTLERMDAVDVTAVMELVGASYGTPGGAGDD